MYRFALVGVIGLGAVLASGRPAQAFWFWHPHQHPHLQHYTHPLHARPVAPLVPFAPVAPFTPLAADGTPAPLTPGQVVAGLQLVWNGLQWFGVIPGGTGTTQPGNTTRPPVATPKPVDQSVVDSINRTDTALKETVDATNALLALARKGDKRLEKVADVPAFPPAAGGGGTVPVGGAGGGVVPPPPK